MPQQLIIGTRQSQLAVWQAEYVADRLRTLYPACAVRLQFFITHGDRIQDQPLPAIGGKGVFTAELEASLRNGEIDLAVHSLKDLPTTLSNEFVIGAIPERASPFDVLTSRGGNKFSELPLNATIGTSSLRRVAQIKAKRPDLNVVSLRGNVPTRINKALAAAGPYDAIILAEAGLNRLGLHDKITERLPLDMMVPAPAQGALAIECRTDHAQLREMLAPLEHLATRQAVEAERAFLNELGSGCRLPVAAYAHFEGDRLLIQGRIGSLDGGTIISVQAEALQTALAPLQLGQKLAQLALQRGAKMLLEDVENALD